MKAQGVSADMARAAAYRRDYRAWVDTLSEKDRKKMECLDKSLLRPNASMGRQSTGGEAGDFSDDIGASAGDVHIAEIEIEVSIEDARFDELVAMAPAAMKLEDARQFARNVVAAEVKEGALGGRRADDGVDATSTGTLTIWRDMLWTLKSAKQPRLNLRVLLMALGWADSKTESMRRLAEDYGYSPEQISNLVESTQQKYRLPKNQFNKSAAATATYKETNGK